MAVRANRRSKAARILLPRSLHPHYRAVTLTTALNQGLAFEDAGIRARAGHVSPRRWRRTIGRTSPRW
jgi:glycine dehydrogenase subunit 1